MLTTKFWFIWPSGFREEDFKKSTNQKQDLPVGVMFVNESGQNEQYFCCLLTFHNLIFSSETHQTKFGRKHLWKVLY
jgi:hypothetical protein